MTFFSTYSDKLIMGSDLATWRARIGLNYYHMCHPLQTRWRSSGGRLYQPGLASWGVGEVMNDTSLVFKGCMTVVALSLIFYCLKVVGMVMVLLLLLSGDIETNPGPDGEYVYR